jgi:DNA replication initiation complex subunit (GINS family)
MTSTPIITQEHLTQLLNKEKDNPTIQPTLPNLYKTLNNYQNFLKENTNIKPLTIYKANHDIKLLKKLRQNKIYNLTLQSQTTQCTDTTNLTTEELDYYTKLEKTIQEFNQKTNEV